MGSLKLSRCCLLLSVVALFFTATTPGAIGQALLKHPNLVILVADDLGWNDVGYHGSEVQTPNIDQLTRQGIELDRFYAYPFCSPTRTALLTGRSPLSLGITRPLGGGAMLPLDEHLLPQTLKAAGYQTLMSGKWHLGNGDEAALPHKRGFDSFYGHTGGFIDYYTHQRGKFQRGGGRRQRPEPSQAEKMPPPDWQRNGKTLIEEGYSTQLIGKEAVRLLQERNKNHPTFLYVTFNAPHSPLQAPQKFIDRYSTLENQNRRIFAAMVDAMDEEIGRILKVIDEEKMRENTIVLFMSDNGGVTRDGASNEPLAKGKGSVYEGGIRVPAVIRWPGVLPKGQKTDQLITVHDLFPTLATALRVEPRNSQPFYGEDLWQSLVSGKIAPHKDVIIASQAIAIFHKQWKMIQTESINGEAPYRELYLIAADAEEEFNLANLYPDLTEELGSIIARFPKGSRPANGRSNAGAQK